MKIGTQIMAPEGWKCLPKGVVFHFLFNSAKYNRVLLVHFNGGKARNLTMAELIIVNRLEFEAGCLAEMIVPSEVQSSLPPWLKELEGMDLSQIDRYRPSSSKYSHQQRVEDRYLYIQPALENLNGILSSINPEKLLEVVLKA